MWYQVNVAKHKTKSPQITQCVYEIISCTLWIAIKAFTPEKLLYSVEEIYGHIRSPPTDRGIHHGEKCDSKV